VSDVEPKRLLEGGTVTLGKRLASQKSHSSANNQSVSKRSKHKSGDPIIPQTGAIGMPMAVLDQPSGMVERPHSHEGTNTKALDLADDGSVTLVDGDKSDEDNLDLLGNDDDSEKRRERRLLQNRKSAKKCRLKKKAEFSTLADEVDALKKENKELHEKVSTLSRLSAPLI